jgi:hypothetical protein
MRKLVVGSLGLLLVAAPAFAGEVRERQERQAERIHQGVKSGQLTPREAGALRAQQRHINQTREHALANDGRIGPGEARHLTREQDVANRDIYRLKHNAAMR